VIHKTGIGFNGQFDVFNLTVYLIRCKQMQNSPIFQQKMKVKNEKIQFF